MKTSIAEGTVDKAVESTVNETDRVAEVLMTILSMNLVGVASRSQRRFETSLTDESILN